MFPFLNIVVSHSTTNESPKFVALKLAIHFRFQFPSLLLSCLHVWYPVFLVFFTFFLFPDYVLKQTYTLVCLRPMNSIRRVDCCVIPWFLINFLVSLKPTHEKNYTSTIFSVEIQLLIFSFYNYSAINNDN